MREVVIPFNYVNAKWLPKAVQDTADIRKNRQIVICGVIIMRAPYQILAIPYRMEPDLQYCVLHRSDVDQYQFVSGGGEDDEKPIEAAIREIYEETSIRVFNILPLTSMAYIPANVISKKHGDLWSSDTIVIPEYAFGFECASEIILSREHLGLEWMNYDDALSRLTWDSNKTALYELNYRLHMKR